MGRREAAAEAYARALAVTPGHPMALARAAGLARLTGPDDPVIEDLRAAAGRPGLHVEFCQVRMNRSRSSDVSVVSRIVTKVLPCALLSWKLSVFFST
jgi:hypothetical protein